MIISDIEVYSSFGKRKLYRARPAGKQEPENKLLPIGACGLKVRFHFVDPEWEDLAKTAVFRNGNAVVDAVIIDDCATIPHEVLTKVMDAVYVGVYGTDSKRNIAIPTIWTQLGTVAGAANPSGRSSAEPTLPYWAQIKEQLDTYRDEMMDREDLKNALIQAKESGAFDGPQGEKGEKGEKGDKGDKGDVGAAGYSPVKDVDYWTAEDQASVIAKATDAVSQELQDFYAVVTDAYGGKIILTDASRRELCALKLYGKTTQNGAPTPEAPVELVSAGDDGSICVTVAGKNLYDPHDIISNNGGAVDSDGWITLSGVAGESVQWKNHFTKPSAAVVPGRKYIIHCEVKSLVNCTLAIASSAASALSQFTASKTVNAIGTYTEVWTAVYDNDEADSLLRTFVAITDTTQAASCVFRIMIMPADCNDTTFLPYTAQTLTVSTPNGLPGFPVVSGGNYTDENGQQWVCDEIDFARGKYVQRVKEVVFDGSADEAWNASTLNRFYLPLSDAIYPVDNDGKGPALSRTLAMVTANNIYSNPSLIGMAMNVVSKMFFIRVNTTFTTVAELRTWLTANPLTVKYATATSIETELSNEELAAYAKLHTNYPLTVVYNDTGAEMAVTYVADTKRYIDKKFAELAAAIVSNS